MKRRLESLYRHYNRPDRIHPDPLEFLHRYPDCREREVVGIVAASLAYGRVEQILKSVARVLEILGPSPRTYLEKNGPGALAEDFDGFVHRFARGHHMAALLTGVQEVLDREGSLEACFLAGHRPGEHATVLPALERLVQGLTGGGRHDAGHLLAAPGRGSACKRLNLFLRWMVRCDAVDPGGWQGVSTAKLIVPLDVHMHRIGRRLGLTRRKPADMRTALEVTEGFRRWAPADPVRYDFALTRFGIRGDNDAKGLFAALASPDGGETP